MLIYYWFDMLFLYFYYEFLLNMLNFQSKMWFCNFKNKIEKRKKNMLYIYCNINKNSLFVYIRFCKVVQLIFLELYGLLQ